MLIIFPAFPFQFIVMIVQGAVILLNPSTCPFPRRVTAIYVPYIMCLPSSLFVVRAL
jgi:hypothetical protein